MKLITILKEQIKKLKEDKLSSKQDYESFIYSIQNDNTSNNIYVLNDTTYLTNVYEVLGIANIVALYSNITDIPKESILLKKNQRIKLYDGYTFFDTNLKVDIKKEIPEFNPIQGKYFILEILNDKNYTKIDSTHVIDLKNCIKLYDYLTKYNQKIDNNLLNIIKNNLNKYNTNDDESYEKLNTKYKYDRKNVGKVILTKFDKYWGKFAPTKFLIYNNSDYNPIDIEKFVYVSKNSIADKDNGLNYYGLNNNSTIFYRVFNKKPNYRQDKIFAVIIKGRLKKDDFSKNEKYILDFVFDLIVEKNTNDGKKYYSVSYINTFKYYNPYKITSYKDFIQINKEIITTIKETTDKIINNQL